MYRTNFDVQQVLKIWPPQGGYQLDAIIADVILPIWDRIGWRAFDNFLYRSASGAVATLSMNDTTNVVPGDKARVVLFAHASHNDAVNRSIQLAVFNMDQTFLIAVGTPILVNQNVAVGLTVPKLVLAPGQSVGAVADGMGAGANLTIRYIYTDLPVGDYIPHL